MSLNIDHRPKNLKQIFGNELIISILKSKIKKKNRPHSYLLTGNSGCGKTTLGRVLGIKFGALGKKENPEASLNYKEFDSADFRGIDTIRSIRKGLKSAPINAKSKVYLLDECHQLTGIAQEALLKALEDTPKHAYFILCTTEPEKLKITLKRRCAEFKLEPLDDEEMSLLLKRVIKKEDKKVKNKVIEQIVEDSLGSPGQALMVLDKIIDLKPSQMFEAAKKVSASQNQAIDLCRNIIKKASWKTISKILNDIQKEDPEKIRRMIMSYCCKIILKGDNARSYLIMDAFREPFHNNGFNDLVLAAYESLYAED